MNKPALCYGCQLPLGRHGDPPAHSAKLPDGKRLIHNRESCYDRAIGRYMRERGQEPLAARNG